MKLDIIKERDTPLLSRKRVTISIEYEGATPSRLDLKKEVAKKVGSKEDLTIIKHVYTRFGRQKAKVIANIYEKAEDLKAVEHSKLVEKHQAKKEEKKDSEKAAALPAEKKEESTEEKMEEAEEKKEEQPAETTA